MAQSKSFSLHFSSWHVRNIYNAVVTNVDVSHGVQNVCRMYSVVNIHDYVSDYYYYGGNNGNMMNHTENSVKQNEQHRFALKKSYCRNQSTKSFPSFFFFPFWFWNISQIIFSCSLSRHPHSEYRILVQFLPCLVTRCAQCVRDMKCMIRFVAASTNKEDSIMHSQNPRISNCFVSVTNEKKKIQAKWSCMSCALCNVIRCMAFTSKTH